VQWACKVLGLPETAFSGLDGTDPRLGVLRANATLDVEACPGSGKTTLLVAKLAILARHWKAAERGICVLSHTNAARREIERKLGATSEGQRLLSYPHYVGTIHGFVNGPVTLLCRPKCSFRPLSVRRRPGFSSPVLSGDDADCRTR